MEEIQKYDCLFNKFSRDFKDKFKKLNCWKKIGDKFGMTPQDVESRYKNIRTAYGRFLKKSKSVPSGSGRDAVPLPKEFANLEWLSIFIEHKNTVSNLQSNTAEDLTEADETTEDLCDHRSGKDNSIELEASEPGAAPVDLDSEYGLSDSFSPSTENSERKSSRNATPEPPEKVAKVKANTNVGRPKMKSRPWSAESKKPTKDEVDKALLKTANSLADHMKNQKQNLSRNEDEETLFCKSLIPRLKKLTPYAKATARLQIEQLFFQLEFANPSWGVPQSNAMTGSMQSSSNVRPFNPQNQLAEARHHFLETPRMEMHSTSAFADAAGKFQTGLHPQQQNASNIQQTSEFTKGFEEKKANYAPPIYTQLN